MTFVLAGAITAGVGVGYNIYKGIKQDAQANAINKANVRPSYQIPQEFYDNLNIANQLAQQGTPAPEYDYQRNAINQNTASAISALSNSANPGANVSGIVRQADQANSALNAQSAQERANNLKLAMQYRGQLAQQKLAAQQWNSFDKYQEQFNKAASLQTAANSNYQNAFNAGASGLGALATNYQPTQTMGEKLGVPQIDTSALGHANFLADAQPVQTGLPYTWGGGQ